MVAPLLTGDAVALRALVRPRWQRWLAGSVIPVAVGVVIVMHTVAAPVPACTDLAPCTPDAAGMVAVGLLLAAACAGPIDASVAAWLSGLFLVVLIPVEQLGNWGTPSPVWTYAVDVGLVLLCIAMARMNRLRTTPATTIWSADVTRATVPPAVATTMDATNRPALRFRLLAGALVVAAVGLGAWATQLQQQVDERQRAASRVSGQVIGHPDELSILVRLPGEDVAIGVLDLADHPVGQRLDLYVDDAGLRQLVSEPYDATAWILLAVVLAGAGLATWRRGLQLVRRRADFLRAEQPVTSVFVRQGRGIAAVYPADARPGEPAVAVIHGKVGLPTAINADPVNASRELDSDAVDYGPPFAGEGEELIPTRPGWLYGAPIPGTWCAVQVDGEVVVPHRPLRPKVTAPPFTPPHLAVPIDGFDQAVPHPNIHSLRTEEIEAIAPADRDLNPHQVHTHQQSPIVSLSTALAAPLAVVGLVRLVSLPYLGWLLIAIAVSALSFGIVARYFLPGRLAWNGAGVAVVTRGVEPVRVTWSHVDLVERNGDIVILHIGQTRIPLPAGGFSGLRGGQRGAEQLTRALRYARDRAMTQPGSEYDVPRVVSARPSLLFPVVFVVYVPLLAWLLQVTADAM